MTSPFPASYHPSTRFKAIALVAGLLLANIGAWAAAALAFSGQPILMGTAFLAYIFGLRHAFDADHIAAIDNVVRKLMQRGEKPIGVGLYFSLGHSSVVVVASAAIALGVATIGDRFDGLRELGGIAGTLISASFLFAIGLANLFVLKSIWAAIVRARHGASVDAAGLDTLLASRGLLMRLFRPLFRLVSRPVHMYPLGLLFGLGFDTATEIGLLGISATQAVQGLDFRAIMVFPALFTAGMALMDTLDSIAMVGAYGWALVKPLRKLWYNLTITATSVVVAIFVGSVEALGLISSELGLTGGPWDLVSRLNTSLGYFGYAVVGVFVASWIASALLYRLRGYDTVKPAGGS